MIPAIRLSYRFSFGGNEYGTFVDLPEGDEKNHYFEALTELLYSADETYEYLKKRAAETAAHAKGE